MGYWSDLADGVVSSVRGIALTFRHLRQAAGRRRGEEHPMQAGYFDQETGVVTLQWPREALPVPDIGRYKLHNEIEDCIVCDKCAKICPVDCIEIEAIRSPEEFGKTSDGTSKRIYAARFDIDMAKCCYCGLCTTVCPTECLTMVPEYDFSTRVLADFNLEFADMSLVEIAQKRAEWEAYEAQKAAAKAAKGPAAEPLKASEGVAPAGERASALGAPEGAPGPGELPKPKMPFRPVMKKPAAAAAPAEEKPAAPEETQAAGPVQETPAATAPAEGAPEASDEGQDVPLEKPKPVFKPRPVMKKKPENPGGGDA